MKHTPGPWFFDGMSTIARDYLHASDQADICYMNEEGGNGESEWFADPEVVIADARLIAAAPDLYAALKKLLDKAYKQNWNDEYQDQVAMAEAALNKAEEG